MAIKNEDKILKYNGLKTLVKNICDNFARISHKHTKSDITDFPTSMPASDVYSWAKQQNKPTYTKSEVGLGNVENKSSATIRGEITKTNVTSALGYTPYTPNEVDNKLSALETNIDWKESVATYDDIATTYPNPDDGWTVNVKDTDYTYRYNGTSWVAISANAIPKATNSVDGLLSKEDHARYDSAKTHADSAHARTDATKVEKSTTNGNIKINGTETNVYTHPSGTNPHGTTKRDLGLGNVGNFKAVSTVASQGLSDAEKSNARTNIGAQVAGSYASSSHNHDDRYYTESEMNTKLDGKVDNSATGANSLLTKTEVWTSTPIDDTYFIRQDVNGGSTFGRVKFSTLWSYIKTKVEALGYTKNTGTVTGVKMNGTSKGTSGVVDLGTVLTGGSQTSTSSADGGSNVYTFSDGSTITVKNGSKGSTGASGANGTSVTVSSVSESAASGGSNVVKFSDGKSVTIKNGINGSNGSNGAAATVTVGTVTTGEAGTSASVTNAGTANAAKLNFTIPRGATGAPGTPGKDGVTPTIKVASGSSIGAVGTPSVTANTSGTTTTFTFNYLKGEKGEKGDPGVNATTTAVATTSANGLMSSRDKTNHDTMYTALSDEITESMVNSLF